MPVGLQVIVIYFIRCFLKASIILNVKVVPNDTFKIGGVRVNRLQSIVHDFTETFNKLNETLAYSLQTALNKSRSKRQADCHNSFKNKILKMLG